MDKQLRNLLESLNIDYEYITEENKQYVHKVYEFETIEEEVSNFFNQVCKMVEEGVDTFIEIGPGKVLAGLNKKIAPEANVYNVFDLASLESTVEALNAEMANV